jgi:hypothetical protein
MYPRYIIDDGSTSMNQYRAPVNSCEWLSRYGPNHNFYHVLMPSTISRCLAWENIITSGPARKDIFKTISEVLRNNLPWTAFSETTTHKLQ